MSISDELDEVIRESERINKIIINAINDEEESLDKLSALEILYISNEVESKDIDPNVHPFFD